MTSPDVHPSARIVLLRVYQEIIAKSIARRPRTCVTMSSVNSAASIAAVFTLGAAAGIFVAQALLKVAPTEYSLPDQPARFALQKAEKNTRALDIEQHFDGSLLKGKRVLITGANRGLGLALATEAVRNGALVYATCRKSSVELDNLGVEKVIVGVDVRDTSTMSALTSGLSGVILDVVLNNAGYFMRDRESVLENTMDFDEELKQIDICAVGMLRVTNAVYQSGSLQAGSKVVMITSQGGSIQWRDVQCPNGGDYGHHMSKSAANMAGKLIANELGTKGISTGVFHPGFVRTEMTSKYSHIWDIEGAVVSTVAAKRVWHEVNMLSPATNGKFINCEDGLEIPW